MKTNTVLKAQHSSYQTRIDESNSIRIQNTQNTLLNHAITNGRFRITDHKIEAIAGAYKQAWGLDRLKALDEAGERLSMVYRLSPTGKILEIDFVIEAVDTSISIEELEILEDTLKNTVSYALSWEDGQADANYAFTPFAVSFSVIVFLLTGEPKTGCKITQVILTPPPLRDVNERKSS